MRRRLLVIDDDSFAHRAYHALPKTIRRLGNKGAGAILGFANFCFVTTRARSRVPCGWGWDTLNAPTYRHEALESNQSRRGLP
jgi:DNA polymerase I